MRQVLFKMSSVQTFKPNHNGNMLNKITSVGINDNPNFRGFVMREAMTSLMVLIKLIKD